MVISTSCGLWRYMIGDTVKFTNKNPYKFVITGRTKHFINAFGEELIVDNAEKGLAKACAETGAQVCEYSAAPVFMDEHAKCRHQWLIEFAKMPDSVEKFAAILDATLKEVNSDYEAKRWKDIALQPLEVIVARPGLFHDWLARKRKIRWTAQSAQIKQYTRIYRVNAGAEQRIKLSEQIKSLYDRKYPTVYIICTVGLFCITSLQLVSTTL